MQNFFDLLIFFLFSGLLSSQREVAMISEMIHTASLVHDDVIDQSDFRRGKPSVNVMWNHKKVKMSRLNAKVAIVMQDTLAVQLVVVTLRIYLTQILYFCKILSCCYCG